jgi:cytochrome c biogenesis factor
VTVDGRYEVSLTDVQTSRGTGEAIAVEVGVRDLLADANQSQGSASSGDVLMAEASVKPYINLVWSGVIVLLVGLGVTIVRRGQDAGKSEL